MKLKKAPVIFLPKSKKIAVIKNRISPFRKAHDGGGLLCNWVREIDPDDLMNTSAPLIDYQRYFEMLQYLPDKVVENLEKGRLAHDGTYPMVYAWMQGGAELLNTIIADGTPIASSSSEARLSPALVVPKNWLPLPGGLPGRTLRMTLRGRGTTLTTAATMTMRNRIASTDVITGTTLHATGAITAHATAQTASQWEWEGLIVCRSVGSTGTVYAQGKAELAWDDLTTGSQHNKFSGSAGQDTPATATFDTTIDEFFEVTGQWSLSTAYSITCHNYILESLN